jgi:hypothetical protein
MSNPRRRAPAPMRRDKDDERTARIDMLLDEFRVNADALLKLAHEARQRAAKMHDANRLIRDLIRIRKSTMKR